MSGCGQYGFSYIDSTGGKFKIYYFEERNATSDNYNSILSCVNENKGDVGQCVHLAALWLETDLP